MGRKLSAWVLFLVLAWEPDNSPFGASPSWPRSPHFLMMCWYLRRVWLLMTHSPQIWAQCTREQNSSKLPQARGLSVTILPNAQNTLVGIEVTPPVQLTSRGMVSIHEGRTQPWMHSWIIFSCQGHYPHSPNGADLSWDPGIGHLQTSPDGSAVQSALKTPGLGHKHQ
jgi:hypothetical protein